MKKIGTTSTGNFIIEMTKAEYAGLQSRSATTSPLSQKEIGSDQMSHTEKANYVAERLKKLSPKKRDGVIRSIEAMFQFSGGIVSTEVERIIATLQSRKFFAISPEGKVTYAT